jgi:hypothetical protein
LNKAGFRETNSTTKNNNSKAQPEEGFFKITGPKLLKNYPRILIYSGINRFIIPTFPEYGG